MCVVERRIITATVSLFHTREFRSIVDSGDIWVSEFHSMNDYAEIETALESFTSHAYRASL
jgi:hypothetical protein